MSLYKQLKNNIIQDQKVANFIISEVSGYMDNLADDGLIYSPDYEDWNILSNDLKAINVFPHKMPYPPSLYQDILIENLKGELESSSYEQTLEDCGINLADYEEVITKIKKWLQSEIKENNKYTYDDYNDFDDLDVHLFRGRSECASGLLEQINKWEKE